MFEQILFQSTRPAWGATIMAIITHDIGAVSIHAPCVGRDLHPESFPNGINEFQSTRPAWGATEIGMEIGTSTQFQSTRPAWGATKVSREKVSPGQFQSTRPAWGATRADGCGPGG